MVETFLCLIATDPSESSLTLKQLSVQWILRSCVAVNQVRRALGRAPGGVRVVGRFDRETIECKHTMEEHSLSRHWPVILSRLVKAGLKLVDRPPDMETTADRTAALRKKSS